ncbi:MAG: HAMP domain-containing histidine kinase [Oscillospiraceae bacterium]|jgi:hypothetical protein|nr:HAMP domain-containing histidine kinase [Oscillospiraceae bacterium]
MPYKLSSLFGSLSEPVVAARGGEIIYRNPAARQTPILARGGLADMIPGCALFSPPDAFLTETSLGGARYTVSGASIDGAVVCTFTPENPPCRAEASAAVASAAASLRGPLALLKLASDRMLGGEEAPGAGASPECAAAMRRGIFAMERALNHLDAFVFPAESGSPLPERSHFDLARACRDLARAVEDALDLPGGRLVSDARALPAPFYGDRRLIERMLLCLIGNAFEFTPDGTSVRLAVRRAGGRILISVTDDGGGLPDGARRGIWARYGSAPGGAGRGAGLGLSVVQSIAKMHGGGALLESRAGIGTSVIVSLPAHEPAYARAPEADRAPVCGVDEILTELAELVPAEKFSPRYLD